MKTYSRVYFFAVSIIGDFSEVANSAKIKPKRKIPDIRGTYLSAAATNSGNNIRATEASSVPTVRQLDHVWSDTYLRAAANNSGNNIRATERAAFQQLGNWIMSDNQYSKNLKRKD